MALSLGRLAPNCIMKNPAGTWSFAGSVDVRLAFCTADGGEPTPEMIDIARQHGPGFAKGLKSRTWPSREEALQAAVDLGAEVTEAGGNR
jgi:hypothetical protein